jgi:transcription-repair coupling factor (superfamily II helicase)
VRFIAASKGLVKVQPDSKLVFRAEWEKAGARMKGVQGLLTELAAMAEGK